VKAIKVTITKYLDEEYYPGTVECKFKDAGNVEHTVYEKYPIVTDIPLDAKSTYPQEGLIVGEVVKERTDADGRLLITVRTEMPWGIESLAGLNEFELEADQLVDYNWK
jgi:hypothetical protein